MGVGQSFFQPILINYTVRNDIDRMKVGLLIKDRMLDDSCNIRHSEKSILRQALCMGQVQEIWERE